MQQDAAKARARILLVDDDQIILQSLGGFLELEGYEVVRAPTVARAVDCLKAARYNLVISDLNMPGSDGMELLHYCRRHHEDTVVILITGYGSIESAVDAIRRGAFDYLTKPIIDDDVRMTVERALRQQDLLAENRQLKRTLAQRYSFDNIVGSDFRMAKVFDLIEAVADSRTTVLITGESGTGKSLIARAIHAHSSRRDGAFVEVSCGALPDTLLESELFGHVKGAFTHAMHDKPGKFAAACGGTIFLDEITSASPQLQVKLLRVLQERQFEPLGSNQTMEADVRVILATNHNVMDEVEGGRFRRDLYYRINVVNIELPSLRERAGDIPLLADFFLHKFLAGASKSIEGFTPEAMEVMCRYRWPGNVRELENCVERAVVLCRQPMIGPDDLPPAVLAGARRGDACPCAAGSTLHDALAGPEKQIIVEALAANNGSRQATADQLGINRTTLYKKMKRLGLLESPVVARQQ
jgi:DNA-binding NtrC family response regulator